MKKIIEKLIQIKNPSFRFAPEITPGILITLVTEKMSMWIRSFKLIIRGRLYTKLFIGKSVTLKHLSRIHLGQYVQLHDYVHLSALGQEFSIGDHTSIGAYSRLILSTSYQSPGNYIRIGKHVGMGEFAYIGGAGGVEIGDECIIGQYLSCHPENHNYENAEISIRHQGVSRKGIRIGKNCWIGSKVTILDGVEIGEGSIIAAGAVVNKSFPAGSIIGGVPARLLKTRNIVQQKAA